MNNKKGLTMNTSRTPLMMGLLLTTLLSTTAWAAEKVGVVGAAGATLTAISEGQTRALKAGDAVYLGDTLATNNSGKAQIIFLDRSSITLKPDSDLTIDRFVYDPQSSSGDLALKSAKGAFRFIGGALSKKKPVKLETPVGTIGIRGGIADATIDASGETDAFFLYGEELTFVNGEGQTTSTTQYGSGFTLASAGQIPQPLAKQDVQAHFDQFRPAPTDAPLPGAPTLDQVNPELNLAAQENASPGDDAVLTTEQAETNGTGGDNAPEGTSAENNPQGAAGVESAPLAETQAATVSTGAPLPWQNVAPVENMSGMMGMAMQTSADNAIAREAADGVIPIGSMSLTNTNPKNVTPTRVLQGFAAGFGTDGIYANDDITKVNVTLDNRTATASGNISLNRVSGTGPNTKLSGQFGGSNGSNYSAPNQWQAGQSTMGFDTITPPTNNNVSGSLQSASNAPALSGLCTACRFVEWGVWNGSGINSSSQTVTANAIPFVVGEVTNTASLPAQGTATYSGASYGTFIQSGNVTTNQGTLQATVDMGARQLSSIEIAHSNVFGQSVVIQGGAAASQAGRQIDPSNVGRSLFQVPVGSSQVLIGGTPTGAATINGALFGPNAQEIGGNFYMDGPTIDGGGIFLGRQN